MCLAHKTLRERISDSYLRPTCRVCAATSMCARVIYERLYSMSFSGCVGAARIYSRAPPASRGGSPDDNISRKIHGTGGTGTGKAVR